MIRTFDELIKQNDGHVTIACDTEFKGTHTLTIQFAARLGEEVFVQVYSSPAIPYQPEPEVLERLLPRKIRSHCRVVIRRGRDIADLLSPAEVLTDLFALAVHDSYERTGMDEYEKELTVTFVGHFWRADFFRIFGRCFFTRLKELQLVSGNLTIQDRRLLSFKDTSGHYRADPVLDRAYYREGSYPLRINYFDTCLTFGNRASLDDLARTFVGVGKLKGFSDAAKGDMLETFRRQPARAYAYAITDALLTLLVKESMTRTHEEICNELGLKGDIPALRSTQGSRVAEIIVRSVAGAAEESEALSHRGEVSLGKVKALLKGGSGDYIADEHLSRFGAQSGQTHGGLTFSRSPTQFFHDARGMFRDVDLSGCYANVMGAMSLYAGRPVIHEPGSDGQSGRLTLKDAVEFVREHAAGQDAWIIKVSGKITAGPNVLIPSTRSALTNANFKRRAAKRRAAGQWAKAGGYGFPFDQFGEARKDEGNSSIFTDVIEAGVVAWPTWLMIRAMPEGVREEYERLEVETILFYPAKMVADCGPEFDALVQKYSHGGTPWKGSIDMGEADGSIRQLIEERIDDDYATLRFQIGQLAQALQQRRQEAKNQFGAGSPAERGYKECVNSLYGVVACRHLATNNIVAANYITATARALAFAMHMSLNGVQVITDGCTYRVDQIPTRTYADCLATCPDYPINRADFNGPFIDPSTIPADGPGFTDWYREHVKRFFTVSGADYDALFGMHSLEHKQCGSSKRISFDALACDGSSNYIKLRWGSKRWVMAGGLKDAFKARSFGAKAKEAVVRWLIRAYSKDTYHGPPPITESPTILAYKEAGQVARTALGALRDKKLARWWDEHAPPEVYYPLGLERLRVKVYKIIKPSAFLFRTPKQQAAFVKAMGKFADATSCGLELLALRRASEGRRKGSIADVAGSVYRLIRSGTMNPTKALNLTRPSEELEDVKNGHHQVVLARKEAVLKKLIRQIDAEALDEATSLTGLFVRLEDIHRIT
jgi:hypothetical protein